MAFPVKVKNPADYEDAMIVTAKGKTTRVAFVDMESSEVYLADDLQLNPRDRITGWRPSSESVVMF